MKLNIMVLATALVGTLLSCNESNVSVQSVTIDSTAVTNNVRPSYALEDTEIHSITSSINKKEYELFVKLPPSYDESSKYLFPVLVLTDADYAFPLVSSISSRLFSTDLIEQFIVVGVSFSKGDDKYVSKTRDYTPTFSPNEENGFSKESKRASGHANKFALFLQNDALPYLAKNYRIDYTHKVLAGHSFGGLFTSYVAVNHPEVFDYYLAGSPSLWYHEKSIFNIEKTYAQNHNDLKSRLFLCIGGLENSKNFHPMVGQMLDFERQLKSRNYPSLVIETAIIPDEGHYTVYPSFITKGILWAFGR